MLQSDMDAQDIVGNTPLHVSVECDALDAIEYLLSMYVFKYENKSTAIAYLQNYIRI